MDNATVPEKFIQILKDNNIFHECELSNHPDKCSDNITTTVFNLDKIKKSFYKKSKISNCVGSADVLYL